MNILVIAVFFLAYKISLLDGALPLKVHSNSVRDAVESSLTARKTSWQNAAACGATRYGGGLDKIVGGHAARPHAFPWLVSLWVEDADYDVDSHMCGGALVNGQFVVTAAHCFLGYDKAGSWKALLAAHDFNSEEGVEIWSKVEKIIVHEKYDSYTNVNDIALIKLNKRISPLPSEDMSVNTICLPNDDDDFTGMKCKVAGWGRLRDYGELPNVLQEVTLPVFGPKKCSESRFYKGRVWDTNICAGFTEGGKDSCQGDSGGPLVCLKPDGRFYLSGVVSWGMGCAAAKSPGVYTNTADFLDWIQSHVEKNLS